jgi:outer membrane autotransporter protein
MAYASSLALAATLPTAGLTQSTDTGGPGKALTTGTVTSGAGTVTDGGPNGGVTVQPGFNSPIIANNATINAQTGIAGLYVVGVQTPVDADVVLKGTNTISAAAGVQVVVGGDSTLDLSAGGDTIKGGVISDSIGGAATLINGANTFLPSTNAALVAVASQGGDVLVNSVGGSVAGPGGGIVAESSGTFSSPSPGGNVVVGQGQGVTTSFNITGSTANAISAQTQANGSATITTGAGGAIDGGLAGILAGAQAGPITIDVGAAIGAHTAPQTGVDAGGDRDITIDVNAPVTGAVTGIYASSASGVVAINSTAAISGGSGDGIQIASAGSIQIGSAGAPLGGPVTGGTNGIDANAAGAISIYAGRVSGGTGGVSAISQGGGNVIANLGGPVTAANGDGVLVALGSPPQNELQAMEGENFPLNITIATQAVAAVNGSGISAVNNTSGSIFITTTGAVSATGSSTPAADGIYAANNYLFFGSGAIVVDALAPVSGVRAGIEASNNIGNVIISAPASVTGGAGIIATAASGISIGTAANPVGPVTGGNGAGIYASSGDGVSIYATSVTSMGGASSSTGGYGVVTRTSGRAMTLIDVTGPVIGGGAGGVLAMGQSGSVTIHAASVDATAAGRAIEADTSAGGAISIAATGSVAGKAGGIYALAGGGGEVDVAADGAVSGGAGPGIVATSGTSGLDVTANGGVSSTAAPAMVLTSGGTASVVIGPGALIVGAPTGPTQGVITLQTPTGAASTITIGQGATVQAAAGSNGVAIYAAGGSVTVNDAGLLMGGVDFSGISAPDAGVLNIEPGGVFVMSGASVFASPANLVNTGGTLASAGPGATLTFTGGPFSYTNAGVVQVGLAGETSPSSLTISGVSTFINAGVVSLANGQAGDRLVIPRATYVGAPGSKLVLDVALGTPRVASDSLTVGTSSGVTSVVIHDVSGGFAAYSPAGIPIVVGATHPGDFVLDPTSSYYRQTPLGPAIEKPGLLFSQLAVTPSATVLVTAPKVEAFQFSTLAAQVESLWYADTARADRQTDLRDELATGDPKLADHPTVWAKVDGAAISRSDVQSFTAGPVSYRDDASYHQDVAEVSVGVDGARKIGGAGGGMTYGAYAGYVGSESRFTVDSTRTLLDGWSLNGHAGYQWPNGVFVNGQIGADWFIAKLKAPDLAGFSNPHANVSVWGASAEAGRRWTLAPGVAIEPSLSLSYMDGGIDTPPASIGAAFQFGDPQSLRVGAGVRLTGVPSVSAGAWRVRYVISARLEDDLLASNRTTLINAGPDFVAADSFAKLFAETGGSVIAVGPGGWSVSVGLRGRWNAGYSEAGANAAASLQF